MASLPLRGGNISFTNDDDYETAYMNANEIEFSNSVKENYEAGLLDATQIIVNHDKKEYCDMFAVIYKHRELGNITNSFNDLIHPLAILTNSERGAMGGGDWHYSGKMRRYWAGDRLEVTRERPDGYKNISYECVWKEN